ncbi:unnamed protein product [Lactuca saligna]|uniref:Uncharacterized protein n=1 Tax=Lactuca saligna TaxID=75948 RepID=A0AA35V727_LACSI|nr:unnamed protein product [Lactuca saligna]
MAKLMDSKFNDGDAGVIKAKTRTCSMKEGLRLPHEYCRSTHGGMASAGEVLLPHQLCKSTGISRFSEGGHAINRPVSQKKDKNLMLPHEFFGSNGSRIAGEEILLPHQPCESVGSSWFSDDEIKRKISAKIDNTVVLPHEAVGRDRSRIAGEEVMLPHQLCESTGGGRFSDRASKHDNTPKKDKTITEEFSDRCQSRCSGGENILLPHELLGNKTDVSDSAIKLSISNKNDQNLLLPCNLSIEMKIPDGNFSKDMIMLSVNLAGTAIELSLGR